MHQSSPMTSLVIGSTCTAAIQSAFIASSTSSGPSSAPPPCVGAGPAAGGGAAAAASSSATHFALPLAGLFHRPLHSSSLYVASTAELTSSSCICLATSSAVSPLALRAAASAPALSSSATISA
eukprot:scaffold18904_cov112-Isochrysis_galbana.AAC.5